MKKNLFVFLALSVLLTFGCSTDKALNEGPVIKWGESIGDDPSQDPGQTPGTDEDDSSQLSGYKEGDVSASMPKLPSWKNGNLDIHFINTGTGECVFLILPDGTQMLIDAASSHTKPTDEGGYGLSSYYVPRRPNDTKRPSEWINLYIAELKKWTGNQSIDHCLVTHFHTDHIGQRVGDADASKLWGKIVPAGLPHLTRSNVCFTAKGDKMGQVYSKGSNEDYMGKIVTPDMVLDEGGCYQRIGIAELLDVNGVGLIVDKAYPNYDYPLPLAYSAERKEGDGIYEDGYMNWSILNYRHAARYHELYKGAKREAFEPGSNTQFQLMKDKEKYPNFEIRNLASNGVIWTGTGTETKSYFPSNDELKIESSEHSASPNENMTSAVIKVSYGKFDFFTGGDVVSNYPENNSWRDTERFLANCTGEVDVLKANHHGSFDGCTTPFLSALDPQVVVVNVFRAIQPRVETYARMAAIDGLDIYTTNKNDTWHAKFDNGGNRILGPREGHVVVRVSPGGDDYCVYYLDDTDPSMSMKVTYWKSYQSRD